MNSPSSKHNLRKFCALFWQGFKEGLLKPNWFLLVLFGGLYIWYTYAGVNGWGW